MATAITAKRGLTRRRLLVRSASTAVLAGLGTIAKPYLSRAAGRPQLPCGIQSGDISSDSAVIWARADRAARMQVECATDENFKTILRAASADALPDSDFTSKLLLDGLPTGQDIFYRVQFEGIDGSGIAGEIQVGHFRTAPVAWSSVSFVWSGDTAGAYLRLERHHQVAAHNQQHRKQYDSAQHAGNDCRQFVGFEPSP